MSRIKLPYGIKAGELVHVAYVSKGSDCQCVCPKCAGALVAAKGEINAEHFRHQDLSDCEGAAEFALRAKIMELLESKAQLTLPASLDLTDGHSEALVDETTVTIESVTPITSSNPLTPRFEIKTSDHAEESTITIVVNLGKKAPKAVDDDRACIEINLADFDELSEERVREAVQERTDCWRWVNRPLAEKKRLEKLQYSRIRTTPDEADRILLRVHSSRDSSFFKPTFDGAEGKRSEPAERSRPKPIQDLSCEGCGRTNIPEKDMQRYKSDTGVGVCSACMKSGKSIPAPVW